MSTISTLSGSFFGRTLSQMAALRGQLDTTREQIATGQRIARGSDDPAAAAQLRRLDRRERLAGVEADNAARLGQDLDAAADEAGAVINVLQRARELAVRAANAPAGDRGREAIAFELTQLEDELFSRANAIALTGEPLFAGLAAGPAFTRDAAGTVTYAGDAASGPVPVAPTTAIERGLPGNQVFEFVVGGVPTSAFAVLRTLSDALTGGAPDPAAAANAALEGIDAALGTVTRAQTILGTRLAWVEQVQVQQDDRAIALAERRSALGDTDLGEAIARLQQTMTALEASQAAFARVSGLTLFSALR